MSRDTQKKNIVWIISEDSNTAEAVDLVIKSRLVSLSVKDAIGFIYRRADYVTAVSSSVRESLLTKYGIPRAKLNVIHNPLAVCPARPGEEEQVPEKYGNFILMVGRLVRIKRYYLAIEAFALLRERRPTLNLVILGEGPEQEELEGFALQRGVSEHVFFHGFAINPWVYMRRAQLLLLTSALEGFSNVVIEAMANSCPVVATACGGPQDIITNDLSGILVSADSAEIARQIMRLDDRRLRGSIVSAALTQVSRYDPEKIARQFCYMFDEILSERGAMTSSRY